MLALGDYSYKTGLEASLFMLGCYGNKVRISLRFSSFSFLLKVVLESLPMVPFTMILMVPMYDLRKLYIKWQESQHFLFHPKVRIARITVGLLFVYLLCER